MSGRSPTGRHWTERDLAIGKGRPMPRIVRRHQSGAILLAVLGFILASTLLATTMVDLVQTQDQREREEQLIFVGDQYRRAISAYASVAGPGGTRSMPQSLDDLLEDRRFPTPMQHLRRPYPDPMTGRMDWDLLRDERGLVGVRSRSTKAPFKRTGFADRYKHFEGSLTYADWVFSATP
jgi:type II secretory pathway pseudopilin PulG